MESITEVYREESQEKHSEQASHSLPPSERQMSMEEVNVINNL